MLTSSAIGVTEWDTSNDANVSSTLRKANVNEGKDLDPLSPALVELPQPTGLAVGEGSHDALGRAGSPDVRTSDRRVDRRPDADRVPGSV